ncbi:hypothetical protein KGY79_04610 [Candidatus Bipolaricaulota bacterium]|nr:hypothetical protein [Candidatus Bipolaricaulota bacterium]
MKKIKVQLIMPEGPPGKKDTRRVEFFSSAIVQKEEDNVYSIVEKFRREVFPGITDEDMREEVVRDKVLLSQVITLHNAAEIRSRSVSVSGMRKKIESGEHVLMSDGLPNVKIAKTRTDELVCLDGHHSLLAYMMSEIKYLHEVPHLMVTDHSGGGLKEEKFHAFFGEHAKKLTGSDWRNYTISWTNPPERQLEDRKQDNMGELLSELLEDDSGG